MKPQKGPEGEGFDWFCRIADSKRGDRKVILDGLKPGVKRRLKAYLANKCSLEVIPEINYKALKAEALLHCYDSSTEALTDLTSKMISDLESESKYNLLECPYCLVRPPGTWDHFLPKEKFPEFSVVPSNLVYVCDPCNRKKGARLYGPARKVVHPYFDSLPNGTSLLSCTVTVTNNVPVAAYKISNVPDCDPYVFSLVKEHFREFDLERLYLRNSKAVLSELMDDLALRYLGKLTARTLHKELGARYSNVAQSQGANHWSAALYIGLRDCKELLNCINAYAVTRGDERKLWKRKAG